MNDETLNHMKTDIGHLVDWTHTHDEEHVNEDKRLNLILLQMAERDRDLDTHNNNHHGAATTIKRNGLLVMAVSILYGLVELFRGGFPLL